MIAPGSPKGPIARENTGRTRTPKNAVLCRSAHSHRNGSPYVEQFILICIFMCDIRCTLFCIMLVFAYADGCCFLLEDAFFFKLKDGTFNPIPLMLLLRWTSLDFNWIALLRRKGSELHAPFPRTFPHYSCGSQGVALCNGTFRIERCEF